MRKRIYSWWLLIPEPRELSAVFTVIYAVALATGCITLIYPPTSIAAEIGDAAMASVGALLIAGALIAMAGGGYENSKLERVGLSLQIWALLIYAVIVIALHVTTPGSRLTQIGIIMLALLGSYVVRWAIIWRRDRQIRG